MTAQRQRVIVSGPGVHGDSRAETGGERQEPAVGAGERSSQMEWAGQVLQSLTGLDRVERAALRLIYSHGMTHTQVARELDLP